MKTRIALWLASAALLGGALAGQETGTTSASAEVLAPDKKLAALIERYNKQQNDVSEAYQKAATDEERRKALAGLPGKEYVSEFRAVAEEAEGTDTAARAWLWVLRLTDDDPKQAWEVVDLLLSEHMQSPAMDELSDELRHGAYQHGEGRVIEALRSIVAESPHEHVRAATLFTLGAVLFESSKPQNKAEGRDCFEAVVTEYGSQAYGGNSTYKAAAEGYLFEIEHLQLGMTAPDFESIDENGVKWKLSDYKGKVVVVDFWGNW